MEEVNNAPKAVRSNERRNGSQLRKRKDQGRANQVAWSYRAGMELVRSVEVGVRERASGEAHSLSRAMRRS